MVLQFVVHGGLHTPPAGDEAHERADSAAAHHVTPESRRPGGDAGRCTRAVVPGKRALAFLTHGWLLSKLDRVFTILTLALTHSSSHRFKATGLIGVFYE
jgi:hypothetical protein